MTIIVTGNAALSIRQIRILNAVADHVSLVQASTACGMSQSSFSRQITGAERSLSQTLFQRGWVGVEPTWAGAIVTAHCRRMMAMIDAAQGALEHRGSRAGDLGYHLTWGMLDAVDAVRTLGSATAAAKYLQTSQPEISRSLAKIGAAIGQKPFSRTDRGLVGTPAVSTLSNLRAALMAEMTAMGDILEQGCETFTGRVAVGLLPFSEQDVVIRVFDALLKRHGPLRLQAVTGSYGALIDALRRGELDFVLGPLRNPAPYETLMEEHLFDEWLTLVTRRDHPLAAENPSLEALMRESWVVGPNGTPTRRFLDDLLLDKGLTPPAQICEMVTFSLAEQMVRQSDSIGLLTYSPRKRSALPDDLRIVPLDLDGGVRKIGLTRRVDQTHTAAHRLFSEILAIELSHTQKKAGKS